MKTILKFQLCYGACGSMCSKTEIDYDDIITMLPPPPFYRAHQTELEVEGNDSAMKEEVDLELEKEGGERIEVLEKVNNEEEIGEDSSVASSTSSTSSSSSSSEEGKTTTVQAITEPVEIMRNESRWNCSQGSSAECRDRVIKQTYQTTTPFSTFRIPDTSERWATLVPSTKIKTTTLKNLQTTVPHSSIIKTTTPRVMCLLGLKDPRCFQSSETTDNKISSQEDTQQKSEKKAKLSCMLNPEDPHCVEASEHKKNDRDCIYGTSPDGKCLQTTLSTTDMTVPSHIFINKDKESSNNKFIICYPGTNNRLCQRNKLTQSSSKEKFIVDKDEEDKAKVIGTGELCNSIMLGPLCNKIVTQIPSPVTSTTIKTVDSHEEVSEAHTERPTIPTTYKPDTTTLQALIVTKLKEISCQINPNRPGCATTPIVPFRSTASESPSTFINLITNTELPSTQFLFTQTASSRADEDNVTPERFSEAWCSMNPKHKHCKHLTDSSSESYTKLYTPTTESHKNEMTSVTAVRKCAPGDDCENTITTYPTESATVICSKNSKNPLCRLASEETSEEATTTLKPCSPGSTEKHCKSASKSKIRMDRLNPDESQGSRKEIKIPHPVKMMKNMMHKGDPRYHAFHSCKLYLVGYKQNWHNLHRCTNETQSMHTGFCCLYPYVTWATIVYGLPFLPPYAKRSPIQKCKNFDTNMLRLCNKFVSI